MFTTRDWTHEKKTFERCLTSVSCVVLIRGPDDVTRDVNPFAVSQLVHFVEYGLHVANGDLEFYDQHVVVSAKKTISNSG